MTTTMQSTRASTGSKTRYPFHADLQRLLHYAGVMLERLEEMERMPLSVHHGQALASVSEGVAQVAIAVDAIVEFTAVCNRTSPDDAARWNVALADDLATLLGLMHALQDKMDHFVTLLKGDAQSPNLFAC